MKVLVMSLLLVSCGVDDDKETDDQKDPVVSETGDIASRHPGKTIFSFGGCKEQTVTDKEGNPLNEEGSPVTNDETPAKHPMCDYHRIAENSECGAGGDRCQITIFPQLEEDDTSEEATLGWPIMKWSASCMCSKKELPSETPAEQYRCGKGKCSLDELQKGVLSKATRNGKAVGSDNKLSKLEVDLLEDIVEHAFKELPEADMFTDYFKKSD